MRKTFAIAAAMLTMLGGVGSAAAVDRSGSEAQVPSGDQARQGLFTSATGTLVRGGQGYILAAEDDGTRYRLTGAPGMLLPYSGERVKVTGSESGRNSETERLAVRTVEPVARGESLPPRGTTRLNFRVNTDGAVSGSTTFYGMFGTPGPDPRGEVADIEELGAIALRDEDGDGVYSAPVGLRAGQRVVARIAVGNSVVGPRKVIHPSSVVQRDNTVVLDGDTTVSTEYTPTRFCGDVPFTPNSDHGAFGIKTSGADCDTARDVAADAENRIGRDYRSHGFECAATEAGGQLGGYDYTCRDEEREITFSAS
ncbi:hypothetical protein CDG81_06135 [Actinopolyspora erythraea]|uniref:Uncharacterized protein n=1 Tax=Actinopolyspora erythraea TaxID=414996 RepID=A0A099D0G9_9ACTN|nr:DUF5818 domain-containing protein [Actinopolyspora erythraea]ASU77957.1 hypothetical protein CDG81_06135 [Actinopolyspora erythraea]KGI79718.1 hypothetical protein IL38_21155 [Actinopolyspora erythraea]